MFIAILFMEAKTWTQLKCTPLGDWIKKMWSIYTNEYYSAMREGAILPFVTTWMDLENTVLSEISHTEKAKNHMISLTCGI